MTTNPSRIIFDVCKTERTDVPLDSADMPKLTLQAYLKEVLDETGMSLRDVEKNSVRGDDRITSSYVGDLVLGDAKNLTTEKVAALARGIKRELEEVLDVIYGKVKADEVSYRDTTIRTLLAEFNSLPEADKKELRPTIDMFLREIRRRLAK